MALGSLSPTTSLSPHSNGGLGLIFVESIALVAHLGSWVLVALVIASKFLLNFNLFLLQMIGMNNLGSLSL